MNQFKAAIKHIACVAFLCMAAVLFLETAYVKGKSADTTKPKITLKLSNTKPVSGNIKIQVTGKDDSGIQTMKWASGDRKVSYFKNSGTKFSLDKKGSGSISITKNDIYTIYAQDKAGNEAVKKIAVSNIDKTKPDISYKLNTKQPTNKNVKITITLTDKDSGVKEAVYMKGKKKETDFNAKNVTAISVNDKGKGSFSVKDNGNYTILATDKAGNQTLQVVSVSNIDREVPTLSLSYKVMNQKAAVTVDASDNKGIGTIQYIKGNITKTEDERWESKGKEVKNNTFTVKSSGKYSVLVEDLAGNKTISSIDIELELKGVWISYLEFANYGRNGFTDESFKNTIDTMFDNVVSLDMNAVIVQVRPFGDAMYESEYFPWSRYISGTQGKDPGLTFDPLEYMVEAAHDRGLAFHAWLNPYRVTTATTNYKTLSEDNPARVWHEDDDDQNDRNVLSFGGNLYYNPASLEVQELIINGIKEIVEGYDVDGIHFDDYFYPALGSKYASIFDSIEYEEYKEEVLENDENPLTIADWRRENVNTLIRNVYSSIKELDETVEFGISPGGFYDSLVSNLGYYVDYKTWMASDEYIDYICPQIYWSFSHPTYPYAKTLDAWLSFRTSPTVKMYVGIANYKAGSNLEKEWKEDEDVLKKQIEYGRESGLVDGFMFFRYDFFYNKVTKMAVDSLLEIL